MRRTLMEVIEEYDFDQRDYIRSLENEIKQLKKEKNEMLDRNLAEAQASSSALLKNILNGTFDNIRKKPEVEAHTNDSSEDKNAT